MSITLVNTNKLYYGMPKPNNNVNDDKSAIVNVMFYVYFYFVLNILIKSK